MTTSQLPQTTPLVTSAAVPGPWWRVVTAAVTGFVAVGAYYGTWYLTEELALREIPVAPPEFLPGDAWGFGAFALLLFVAAPMSLAFLTAAVGHPAAAPMAMFAGGLLMGWIVVQVLLIGLTFWLQPVMFVLGVVVLALGYAGYRPARTD